MGSGRPELAHSIRTPQTGSPEPNTSNLHSRTGPPEPALPPPYPRTQPSRTYVRELGRPDRTSRTGLPKPVGRFRWAGLGCGCESWLRVSPGFCAPSVREVGAVGFSLLFQ